MQTMIQIRDLFVSLIGDISIDWIGPHFYKNSGIKRKQIGVFA